MIKLSVFINYEEKNSPCPIYSALISQRDLYKYITKFLPFSDKWLNVLDGHITIYIHIRGKLYASTKFKLISFPSI